MCAGFFSTWTSGFTLVFGAAFVVAAAGAVTFFAGEEVSAVFFVSTAGSAAFTLAGSRRLSPVPAEGPVFFVVIVPLYRAGPKPLFRLFEYVHRLTISRNLHAVYQGWILQLFL